MCAYTRDGETSNSRSDSSRDDRKWHLANRSRIHGNVVNSMDEWCCGVLDKVDQVLTKLRLCFNSREGVDRQFLPTSSPRGWI